MKFSLFALPIIAISLLLIGLCGNVFSPPALKTTSVTTKTLNLETPTIEVIKIDDLNESEKVKEKK